MKKSRCPNAARLIAKEFSQLRKESRQTSLRAIASRTGLALSTLQAWKSGERPPQEAKARRLAEYFYPGEDQKSRLEQFLEQLRIAVELDMAPREQKASDRLAQPLKIGVFDYQPLSSADPKTDGFLDEMLRRFLRFAGLDTEDFEPVEFDRCRSALVERELDIIVGYMETVDRTRELKFFPTPISLPVNGVILIEGLTRASQDKTIERVREALAPKNRRRSSSTIHAIYRPDEIGGLHCKFNLRLGTEGEIDHYSADQYLKALQAYKGYLTPVAVVDELTCLKILELAGSEGVSARPVVPFAADKSYNELPRYSVGYAVSADDSLLISYLHEALPTYFLADTTVIEDQYRSLLQQLAERARTAAFPDISEADERAEYAMKWAQSTLGLEPRRHGFDEAWDGILSRMASTVSRDPIMKVLEELTRLTTGLSKNLEEIKSQIAKNAT